jgi:hypothetical protein
MPVQGVDAKRGPLAPANEPTGASGSGVGERQTRNTVYKKKYVNRRYVVSRSVYLLRNKKFSAWALPM